MCECCFLSNWMFGFHLNDKQQAFVVERLRELLVESFA